MKRIVLIAFLFSLFSSYAFSQLRFPVEKGYIKDRKAPYNHPAQEIQMEGNNDSVYACEPGWIISIFEVEGYRYILVSGKYFIAYGPFVTVWVNRMDSIAGGKCLGKIAFDMEGRKCLDMIIMESAEKKLLLENAFPGYVRKELIHTLKKLAISPYLCSNTSSQL